MSFYGPEARPDWGKVDFDNALGGGTYDLKSAFLELELLIGNVLFLTDHFNLGVPGDYFGLGVIGAPGSGATYLSTVFSDAYTFVGDTVFVSLELLDFYSGSDVEALYLGTGGLVGGVFSDDVTVNSATLTLTAIPNPEPGSLLLLGTGLLGLVAWRMRKGRA